MSTYRNLVALPRGNSRIYPSWRMLSGDDEEYTVERRRSGESWQSAARVSGSTNILDKPSEDGTWEYRVATNGDSSESVAADSAAAATNVSLRVPLPSEDPRNTRQIIMGDLRNDGRTGFVIKYIADNRPWLRAVSDSGDTLWDADCRLPARGSWDRSANHVPFACWDLDGDGRTEVIYHDGGDAWPDLDAESFYEAGREGERLVIADAETGEIKRTAKWPGVKGRIMLTVGHVRGIGESASVVVLDETYGDVTVTAVDGATAETLWRVDQARPAGHNLDVADIDGDGVQEVIVGGICYNGDGSIRWEAEEFGHTDMSKPANVDPDRPGLEIWYLVESHNPGVYLVDRHGKTIWKEPYRHAHFGWIARHTADDAGLQTHAAEDRRKHDNEEHHPVFLRDGTHWANLTNLLSRDLMPAQWDGGDCTAFIHRKQTRMMLLDSELNLTPIEDGELPPSGRYGRNILLADIVGDYRENVVTVDESTHEMILICNPKLLDRKKLSPMESFYYRHDRSQHGSGYYMYTPPHATD